MDGLRNRDSTAMKGWPALFGGDRVTGPSAFPIAFIPLGGAFFAFAL